MLNVVKWWLIGGLEMTIFDQNSMFFGLLDTLHSFICPQSSLFRFCSMRAFFWYQNWVYGTLRSHFIAKNSEKIADFRPFWGYFLVVGHK